MTIRARVEPIDRDIAVIIANDLSPAAASRMIAGVARESLNDAKAKNRAALGRVPTYETFVDGAKNTRLEAVRPDGRIVFEFDLLLNLFAWIGAQLVQHSPVGPLPLPTYHENHLFFADGVQMLPGGEVPEAASYVFVNVVKYARKIERGLSPQAPDGVYEVVAVLAQKRFGNIARVRFTYRALAGSDTRQPAIEITMGR